MPRNVLARLSPIQSAILLGVPLLAYSSQIVLPAFNADDIIQTQPVSGDQNTFLAQGRWGYYFVFQTIFASNPMGAFAALVGIALFIASALVSARIVQLSSPAAICAFALTCTVSIYFSATMSFDSTRVAYPLSYLIGLSALLSMLNGRWLIGVLLFALAPSLFPASVQICATVLLARCLYQCARRTDLTRIIRDVLSGTSGMAVGLVLYYAITSVSPAVTGIPLLGRSSIDPFAAIAAHDRFWNILIGHAIPLGRDLPYFNMAMQIGVLSLVCAFLYRIVRAGDWTGAPLLAVLAAISFLGLFVAPFSLAFASPIEEFGPRALTGFSFAHGVLAGIAIELARPSRIWRETILPWSASVLLVAGTSVAISQAAYDEYVVSRNDFLATNRTLSRIEWVAYESGLPPEGPIHLIVKYDRPSSMSPSGPPNTSRAEGWSREWIFRHIDPRIAPVAGDLRDTLLSRVDDLPPWPATGSVVVLDGVVIVGIN